jgi:hypothetical protein
MITTLRDVGTLSAMWQKLLLGISQAKDYSAERFSRWLRGLCTISLSTNTAGDRLKAIGYIEQALSVLEQHHESDQVWPRPHPTLFTHSCQSRGTALPHGRTPMVARLHLQHWDGMLTVCLLPIRNDTLVTSPLLVLPSWMKQNDGLRQLLLSVALFPEEKNALKRLG